jgi:hypothetical protein
MQGLWSRVLAGEANELGAFAKRTVNLLGDLDKDDAILFTKLCGFGWMIGNVVPLIFDVQAQIYNDVGINFSSLSHLESLGLVQFNHLSGFRRLRLQKTPTVFYYGQPVELTLPKDSDNELELGHVLLTRAGQQLAPVCGSKGVDGFFEYVKERWATQSLIPKPETEPVVPGDAAQ